MKTTTKKLGLFFIPAVFACAAALALDTGVEKVSADSAFAMTTGASVRLEENNNGIRFQANLSSDKYSTVYTAEGELKDENVKFGVLIVPADLMANAGVSTSYDADYDYIAELSAAGVDYASMVSVPKADGAGYVVNGSVTKLRAANCGRAYFGLAYIATADGASVSYEYAPFVDGENVRTMAQVAQEAIDSDKYADDETLLASYVTNAETIQFNAKSAATCTENGYTQNCWLSGGKYYTDSALTQEIAESELVLAASGHAGGTATVGKQAVCEKCAEGYGSVAVAALTTPADSVVGNAITIDTPAYADSVTDDSVSYRKYGDEDWTALEGDAFTPSEIATYQVKYTATVDGTIPFEAIKAISVVSPYTITAFEKGTFTDKFTETPSAVIDGTNLYGSGFNTVKQALQEDGTYCGELGSRASNIEGWMGWTWSAPYFAMADGLESTVLAFEANNVGEEFVLPVEIQVNGVSGWLHREVTIPAGKSTVTIDFGANGIVADGDKLSTTTLNGMKDLIFKSPSSLDGYQVYIDNLCYVPEDPLETSTPTTVREGGNVEFTAPSTTALGGTVNGVEVAYSKYGEDSWTTLTADGNGNYAFTPTIATGKVEEVYQVKYTASVTNGDVSSSVEQIDTVSVILASTYWNFDSADPYNTSIDPFTGEAFASGNKWGDYYGMPVTASHSLYQKEDGTMGMKYTGKGYVGFSYTKGGSAHGGGYDTGIDTQYIYFTIKADTAISQYNFDVRIWGTEAKWLACKADIGTTETLVVLDLGVSVRYLHSIDWNMAEGNDIYIDNIGFGNPNA